MTKKGSAIKWTKKFRVTFISVCLAFVVALGGAMTAVGLTVAGNRRGGNLADSTAGEEVTYTPEETFEKGEEYASHAEAWSAAIAYSLDNEGACVQFNLTTNWVADATNGFGTATEEDSSFGSAGALSVPYGATVILNISKNVKLDRGLTNSDAIAEGYAVEVFGTLVVDGGGAITGGNNTGDGGGIATGSNAALIIEDAKIEKNTSGNVGGGIIIGTDSTLIIKSGEVSNNTSTSAGGGVYSQGTFTMVTGTISNNASEANCGGVCINYGNTFTMKNGTISGNTAKKGAGVYVANSSTFIMEAGTITENYASEQGGAVCVGTGSTFTLNDGILTNDTAVIAGGEVLLSGTFNMNGGTIAPNVSAGTVQQGVYMGATGEFNLNGGTFTIGDGVNTIYSARGVAVAGGTFNMSGGEFTGFYARTPVVVESGEFNMSGGKIHHNDALEANAGGVSVGSSNAKMTMSGTAEISDNHAGAYGGGISLNSGAELEMTGGTITRNTAGYGGGVAVQSGTATFKNVTISGNTATYGGAIFAGATITLENVTITENTAYSKAGGVYVGAKTTLKGEVEITDNTVSGFENNAYVARGAFLQTEVAVHSVIGINADVAELNTDYDEVTKVKDIAVASNAVTDGFVSDRSDWSVVTNDEGTRVFLTPTAAPANLDSIIDKWNYAVTQSKATGKFIQVDMMEAWNNTSASSGDGFTNVNGWGGTPTVPANAKVILNLNGYNFSTVGGTAFKVDRGDLILVGTGNISSSHYASSPIEISNGGRLTLNGPTIKKGQLNTVVKVPSGRFTMNSGSILIDSGSGSGISGYPLAVEIGSTSTFTMNGGSVKSTLAAPTSSDIVAGNTGAMGVSIGTGGTFNLNGGTISGFKRSQDSAAVKMTGGEFNMNGGTISGNQATNGAGVYMTGGTFNMTGGQIINNGYSGDTISTESGGGVYVAGGTFNLNGGAISGNKSSTKGGGVYVADGMFQLQKGTIGGNSSGKGGGIYYATMQTCYISSATIKANTTTGDGMAIYVEKGNMFFQSGEISGHVSTSVNVGGAVYVAGGLFGLGSSSGSGVIKNNKAQNGGGIAINGGSVTINHGTISDNTAMGNGGGVYLHAGSFSIQGGTIKNNTAMDNGGGIYSIDSFTMTSGTITENKAMGKGGGVYAAGATFEMSGGTVTENTAANAGGVYVAGGTFKLSGTGEISKNNLSVADVTGGVLVNSGEFVMDGGTISGNMFDGLHISSDASCTLKGGEIKQNRRLGVMSYGETKMYGGTISGNTNKGVYLPNGTFDMYDGEIIENELFGVDVWSVNAIFTMYGGSISNNKDGGVSIAGTFNLVGGTISENENCRFNARGISVKGNGTLNIGGDADKVINVTNNHFGEEEQNIYVHTDKVINIVGVISADSRIGVSSEVATATLTSGLGSKGGLNTVANTYTAGERTDAYIDEVAKRFFADADDTYVGVTKDVGSISTSELKFVTGLRTVTTVNIDGSEKEILVDNGTAVTYAIANGTVNTDRTVTLKYTYSYGGVSRTSYGDNVYSATVNAGYSAKLFRDPNPTALVNGGVNLQIDSDRTFQLKSKANEDTPYEVYYVLENNEGGYHYYEDLSALNGAVDSGLAKKPTTQHGKTNEPATYLNQDNRPLVDGLDKYEFDKTVKFGTTEYLDTTDDDLKISGAGNRVIIVLMKARRHTVTFNNNGGSIPEEVADQFVQEVIHGEQAINPLKKDGVDYSNDFNLYGGKFGGWYTDEECTDGNEVDFTAAIEEDTEYFAKWEGYVVTYSMEPDDVYKRSTEYTNNYKYTISADGTKIQFPYTNSLGAQVLATFNITAAEGNPESYPITLDHSIMLNNPTAEGYSFRGWYTKNGGRIYSIDPGMNQNLELYARWRPAEGSVTLNARGGGGIAASKTVTNTQPYGTISTPTRAGYQFVGWFTSATIADSAQEDFSENGELNSTESYRIKSTSIAFTAGTSRVTTLYAAWAAVRYQLTYSERLSDNSSYEGALGKLTYSIISSGVEGDAVDFDPDGFNGFPYESLVRFKILENPGYVLSRIIIRSSANDNGTSFTNGTTRTVRSNIFIEAVYSVGTYSIRYAYDNNNVGLAPGAQAGPSVYTIRNQGDNNILFPDDNSVKKTGYAMQDWYVQGYDKDSTVSSTEGLITLLSQLDGKLSNVTLVSKWNPVTTSVVLVLNDAGTSTEVINGTVGDSININPSNLDNNLVLIGWSNTPNGGITVPVRSTNPDDAENYQQATYTIKPSNYLVSEGTDNGDQSATPNSLYAVWHVANAQGVILQSLAENGATEVTYKGQPYYISAKPLYPYTAGENTSIAIRYQWRKDNQLFGDSKTLFSYNYDASNTEWATITLPITNVADSGEYTCELTVIGGDTSVTAKSSISFTVNPAQFTSFRFNGGSSNYNGNNATYYVQYRTTGEGGAEVWKDANPYIPLDARASTQNSIKVTYSYSHVDDEGTVTEPQFMNRSGVYTITAHFEMPTSGVCNYLPIEDQTCTYEIKKKSISNIKYVMVTVDKDGKETPVEDESGNPKFTNEYNGLTYMVKAVSEDIASDDDVVIVLTNASNSAYGTYEALLNQTLSGADAENYELATNIYVNSQVYSITRSVHDLNGIQFSDTTVTYDGDLQELYLVAKNEDGELGEIANNGIFYDAKGNPLKATYTIERTLYHQFTPATNDLTTNGGVLAGEYIIRLNVSEIDGNNNFEAIDEMSATLTISRASFFDMYEKADMLGDFYGNNGVYNRDFDTETYSKVAINGSYEYDDGLFMDFNDDSLFTLSYVYRVLSNGNYTNLFTGDADALEAYEGFNQSGYYELIAKIAFNTDRHDYINNYEAIGDVTLVYTIAKANVTGIEVVFKNNPEYWLNEGFDKNNVVAIKVTYATGAPETINDRNRINGLTVYQGVVDAASVESGDAKPLISFGKVGSTVITIGFLGGYQTFETGIVVRQKVTAVEKWLYENAEGNFVEIPADGLPYNKDGYKFKAEFICKDTNNNNNARSTVDVSVKNVEPDGTSGKYVLPVISGSYELVAGQSELYVLENMGAAVTGSLKINKSKDVSVDWKYNGAAIPNGIKYTGSDITSGNAFTATYSTEAVTDKPLNFEMTDKDGTVVTEIINAGVYTFKATAPAEESNYDLQGLEKKVTVVAEDVPEGTEYEWQYSTDGTTWSAFPENENLTYIGKDYQLRIKITDGPLVSQVPTLNVVATPAGATETVSVLRNAGTYVLASGNSNYKLSETKTVVIDRATLTIDWTAENEVNYFTYTGAAQFVTASVSGLGDDSVKQVIEIVDGSDTRTAADKYKATAKLVEGFEVNYTLANPDYDWEIKTLQIVIGWDKDEEENAKNEFGYTGNPISPVITSINFVEGEEDAFDITFKFQKYDNETEKFVDVERDEVKTFGTYRVIPEFAADAAVKANYAFEDLEHEFKIIKSAPEITGVNYEEYIENVTFASTPVEQGEYKQDRGLRESKLVATFADGKYVAGKFVFLEEVVVNEESGETKWEVVDGRNIDITQSNTTLSVRYRFIPNDTENYLEAEGTVNITVLADTAKTGVGGLVLDERTFQKQYSIGTTIRTVGLKVYQAYTSYYVEGGVAYGKRVEVKANDVHYAISGFNGDVTSYVVSEADLDGDFGSITLKVLTDTAETSTELTVIKDTPKSIKLLTENEIKKDWYVGELFSFNENVWFEIEYVKGGSDRLPASSVSVSVKGSNRTGMTAFTEDDAEKTIQLEFSFLKSYNEDGTLLNRGVSCDFEINVKAKQDLSVNTTNYVIPLTDGIEDVDWAKTYGITINHNDQVLDEAAMLAIGVTPSYQLTYGDTRVPAERLDKGAGMYYVEVAFTINNPQYNSRIANKMYSIEVRRNPYKVVNPKAPTTGLSVAYANRELSLPTVSYDGVENTITGETVSGVEVIYTVNGKPLSEVHIVNRGTYNVEVRFRYNGEYIDNGNVIRYTFTVTQAENEWVSQLTMPTSVKEGEALNPTATAKFGTVKFVYMTSEDGTPLNTVPTEVGTYWVKAIVEATENYKGFESAAKSFTINKKNVTSAGGENVPEVDVSGEKGIEPGVTVTVTETSYDDVNIRKQNALAGYEIYLMKGGEKYELPADSGEVTVKLALTDELKEQNGLHVFMIDGNGNEKDMNATLSEDGNYLVFKTSKFAKFVITSQVEGAPAGLIAGVSIGAVIAAVLIVLCVLAILKKRSK